MGLEAGGIYLNLILCYNLGGGHILGGAYTLGAYIAHFTVFKCLHHGGIALVCIDQSAIVLATLGEKILNKKRQFSFLHLPLSPSFFPPPPLPLSPSPPLPPLPLPLSLCLNNIFQSNFYPFPLLNHSIFVTCQRFNLQYHHSKHLVKRRYWTPSLQVFHTNAP